MLFSGRLFNCRVNINPLIVLIVLPEGQGVRVADALAVLQGGD